MSYIDAQRLLRTHEIPKAILSGARWGFVLGMLWYERVSYISRRLTKSLILTSVKTALYTKEQMELYSSEATVCLATFLTSILAVLAALLVFLFLALICCCYLFRRLSCIFFFKRCKTNRMNSEGSFAGSSQVNTSVQLTRIKQYSTNKASDAENIKVIYLPLPTTPLTFKQG